MVVLAMLLASCVPAAVAAASGRGAVDTSPVAPVCRSVRVPVSLAPGQAAGARLDGQVCYPTDPARAMPGAVQVLVAGLTYGASYWDFPYDPDTYSYVRAATAAGFTTFSFDRIGTGRSTRPLGTQVSIPSNAYTVHQAIQQLRDGAVDGTRYDRVDIVGHSLGSLIVWYEAGTYHDVDAVVASGILHSFNTVGVAKLLTTLYPAALDPRFLGRVIDPSYLTTLPGTREGTFYYAPNTDPGVVRVDEATKETGTVPEAAGVFAMELPGLLSPVSHTVCATLVGLCDGVAASVLYGITRDITVPVLDVVGQYDSLLCGEATGSNRCTDLNAVQQDESAYYTGIAQRCLTVAELPNSGHDINLERNAQTWFALANNWSRFTLEHTSAGSSAPCWAGNGPAGVLLP